MGPGQQALQRAVDEAWRNAFPGVPVEGESDFYSLGGDSMTAAQIVAELSARLALRQSDEEALLEEIFNGATRQAVADFLGLRR
jgi:acyl carrier protein